MTENIDPKNLIGRILYVKEANIENYILEPILIFVEHTKTNEYSFYYDIYYIKEKKFQNVAYDHETIKDFISSHKEKKLTGIKHNSKYQWMII